MDAPNLTGIHPLAPTQNEDADAQKLAAEVRQVNAQRRKTEFEALEIKKRISAPWYQGRFFLQAIVGAIVGSALLAAWLITYMQPILSRKQEIASLDAAIQSKLNEQQRLENEQRTKALAQENKTYSEQLASLSQLNSSLRQQQAEVERHASELQQTLIAQADQLNKLAKQKSAAETQLSQLAKNTEAAGRSVQQQIAGIKADQGISEAQAKNITDSLIRNALKDTTWHWRCPTCTDPSEIYINLLGDGAFKFNYTEPTNFRSTPESSFWKVEDGKLIVSWNKNFSVDTLTFPSPTASKAEGTTSNPPGVAISIEKVR
jgi:myosin heavy subunit